jgi:hypothetical protein
MEKLFGILVGTFAGGLYLYMLIGAHTTAGIFKNFYSQQCARVSKLWRIPGYACLAGSAYVFYQAWLGMAAGSVGMVIAGGAGLALALLCFAGFYQGYTEEE